MISDDLGVDKVMKGGFSFLIHVLLFLLCWQDLKA